VISVNTAGPRLPAPITGSPRCLHPRPRSLDARHRGSDRSVAPLACGSAPFLGFVRRYSFGRSLAVPSCGPSTFTAAIPWWFSTQFLSPGSPPFVDGRHRDLRTDDRTGVLNIRETSGSALGQLRARLSQTNDRLCFLTQFPLASL
jgi:hypothetical protein